MRNLMRSVGSRLMAAMALAGGLIASTVAGAVTLAEIQGRGTVRIGVLTGSPPMGMIDEKGDPSGYDVDVAAVIGRYLALPVKLVPLTPPARIPALQTGQVDFLIATLAPTGERAKTVMFTTPYSAFDLVIVSGPDKKFANLDALKGKRVAVNRGSSQETALRNANVPGLEIVVYEDDSTSTQAVLSGQVDAAAIPSTVAQGVMKQMPGAIQSDFSLFHQGNSMTTLLGDFELHQYLNTAIYVMKVSGELDRISMKWTGEPLPPTLPTF
jgi:polar amino acid transport system substrate-binding protein